MTAAVVHKPQPDKSAEVSEAFAKSINDIDASRRVGWAKMYAALAAGEKAEKELVTARQDIAMLSMFAGFSWGAMQKLGLQEIYQTYLRGDASKLGTYFPDGAINQGRNVGEKWADDWKQRIVDKTEYLKARAAMREANQEQMAAARGLVREEMLAEYGFADKDELHAYLAAFKGGAA